jgi:hypothetical protein
VIQAIVDSLKRKARYCRSPGALQTDIRSCIETTINTDWIRAWFQDSAKKRKTGPLLQFMLCDLDPTNQSTICLYEVHKSREVKYKPAEIISTLIAGSRPARGRVAVIGYGRKFVQAIYNATLIPIGKPSQYRDREAYRNVRALMAEGVLSSYFQDMDLKEVGGPLVITLVLPDGIYGPCPMWPPDAGASDVQITRKDNQLVMFRPSTGEKHVLHSIFDYAASDFSRRADAMARDDDPHY